MSVLNQSDQFDSVTCSCVADIDFDGNNEIILGTYGQVKEITTSFFIIRGRSSPALKEDKG